MWNKNGTEKIHIYPLHKTYNISTTKKYFILLVFYFRIFDFKNTLILKYLVFKKIYI